jgi:hypothetical protein
LTLDKSKRVPALVGVFLLASIYSFADTAILVALPAEQSALSREVRMVGQSVELAQHRVSIGYHLDRSEPSAGGAVQVGK